MKNYHDPADKKIVEICSYLFVIIGNTGQSSIPWGHKNWAL